MANTKLLIFPVVAYVTLDQSLTDCAPLPLLITQALEGRDCFLLHGFMAAMLLCHVGCRWSLRMDLTVWDV